MAQAEQDEAYEKALSASLARVMDMLKFAEAKNAALLAFSSAWIAGLVTLLSPDKTPPPGFRTMGAIALGLFIAAAVIALVNRTGFAGGSNS